MDKMNPLFILISAFIIMCISFYSLQDTKVKQIKIKENYNSFMEIANKYATMDKSYNNIKSIENRLETITKKTKLNKVTINKIEKIIKVSITVNDEKKLQNFINKLLNEKFNITKFTLEKNNLYFEIGIL